MRSFFAFNQAHGSKFSTSWLIYIHIMLYIWTGVESWSYFYSNDTMDWSSAREWCREHYTDMVAIQNQEEITHLKTILPWKAKYYWIGIRKIDNVWTWVGTNKPLTPEATNWAIDEPNNGRSKGRNEDCVEMYIKRSSQAGKWNDERCGNKKTALCYTAACKNDSCVNGECVETINSKRCECFEGFYGEKCEHVVRCKEEEVIVPAKATVKCSHIYGNYTYDSLCQYSCEEGYQLNKPNPMKCTASGNWSEQHPSCELVECKELSRPERGFIACSNPLGNSSYKSSCVFSCEEGYVLDGSQCNSVQCGASGLWNDSQPSCAAVQCPAIQKLENGIVNCGEDEDVQFSYGRICSFSCSKGFRLLGSSTATCMSTARWSEEMPRCEAITCSKPKGEVHMLTKCSDKLEPGSTCSFTCDSGFELQGAPIIQCSEGGTWNANIPICKARHCSQPEEPEWGWISCRSPASFISSSSAVAPFPQGSICNFMCKDGHELKGPLSTECTQSGQWSSLPPTCTAVQCPAIQKLENGIVNCGEDEDVQFSYGRICSFSCSKGFRLLGSSTATCMSTAKWSEEMPRCEAITCSKPKGEVHMLTKCSDKLEPGSTCSFTCDSGFELQGAPIIQCSEGGTWNANIPICKARHCSQPEEPEWGWISCRSPASFISSTSAVAPFPQGSICNFMCKDGHELKGPLSTECTQSGQWSSLPPTCTAVQCPAIQKLENGIVNCGEDEDVQFSYGRICSFSCSKGFRLLGSSTATCMSTAKWSEEMPRCEAITCSKPKGEVHMLTKCSDKLEPGSTCSFTCDSGFELQGAPIIQCSEGGTWNANIPICKARHCSQPEEPEWGWISCRSPASFISSSSAVAPFPQGSICNFMCKDGHELKGPLSTECTQSGQWSSLPPTCTAIRCPMLNASDHGGVNCSHSDLMKSQCSFTCDQGYSLHGHQVVTCNRHGNWTGETPVCRAHPEPFLSPTAMGLTAGGAVSLSGLSLAVWLLKRFKNLKERKFSLSSTSDVGDPTQLYKSIDSLI